MPATGKWEFDVAPGKQAEEWVNEMDARFRADGGRIYEHRGPPCNNGFPFDDSVGGLFLPATAEIHLFYSEEGKLAFRAEELAHYFQYKEQGFIGKTEQEIGADRIDANEKQMLGIMESHGFVRRK